MVNAKSRVSIDWAYSNLGLFTSTGNPNVLYWSHGWATNAITNHTSAGNPNVTVSWPGGHSILLDAGQTLIIKAEGSFNVE